jgi:hypothetical protein
MRPYKGLERYFWRANGHSKKGAMECHGRTDIISQGMSGTLRIGVIKRNFS